MERAALPSCADVSAWRAPGALAWVVAVHERAAVAAIAGSAPTRLWRLRAATSPRSCACSAARRATRSSSRRRRRGPRRPCRGRGPRRGGPRRSGHGRGPRPSATAGGFGGRRSRRRPRDRSDGALDGAPTAAPTSDPSLRPAPPEPPLVVRDDGLASAASTASGRRASAGPTPIRRTRSVPTAPRTPGPRLAPTARDTVPTIAVVHALVVTRARSSAARLAALSVRYGGCAFPRATRVAGRTRRGRGREVGASPRPEVRSGPGGRRRARRAAPRRRGCPDGEARLPRGAAPRKASL